MSSTKFLAILPEQLSPGDKVRIKGRINENAEQFSINFANETCRNPDNITYHFKWILREEVIVEDYKQNGMWMDHKASVYNAFDGRFSNKSLELDNDSSISNSFNTANHGTDAYLNPLSLLGNEFALEFAFQSDAIYVYLIEGEDGRNRISRFEPEFELSDIQSVQVWGDVDKVNELTFIYN